MAADIVQSNYGDLEQVSTRFQKLHDQQVQMESMIRQMYEQLREGWEGTAADNFFKEMNTLVFPGLKRLQNTLVVGSEVSKQIAQIFRQAEEEAAKGITFGDGGAAGNSNGGTGTTGAGGVAAAAGAAAGVAAGGLGSGGSSSGGSSSGGSSSGGSSSGGSSSGGSSSGGSSSGGSASAGASTELPGRVPTDKIFSDDYMDRMIGSQVKGANDPELNSAMETITSGKASEEEIQNALRQIAKSRGLSMEEVTANYNKFQELRQEAAEIARKTGNTLPDNVNFLHPNFLGSTSSLRYGKVVGDALGIDPVFASMLNPTGGLVGNGNYAVDAGERPVGYHGIMHDAAGYLKNYHNEGPGYNYLGQENRDPRDPLTGQESGIRYWNRKMAYGLIDGNGINLNPPVVTNVLAEVGGWGLGKYTDIKTEIPKIWESTKSAASDTWNSVTKGVSDLFSF